MSKARQSSRIADSVAVRTFGVTFHSPQHFRYPAPGWDQLICATQGAFTVHAGEGWWVLAAQRALWAPAGVSHEIEIGGPAALRILYFRARAARELPRHCCAVNLTPLLRELVSHTVSLGALDRKIPEQRRLAGVLLDQLRGAPAAPMQLPLPSDPRARKAAALLREQPARTLAEAARKAGAGVRTLQRLFPAETGLSVGAWMRRMRLLHALRLLAGGANVTTTAAACGYSSTSAFVSMFRLETGSTPARYFRAG